MQRIAWLTDLHLDVLNEAQREAAIAAWRDSSADAFWIGGDLGQAHSITDYLAQLDEALERPIYFVLGNHDFYRGAIRDVRARVAALCSERPRLHYLSTDGPHPITDGFGLVGHDGWSDARIGDYERSTVMLNDYELIEELKQLGKQERRSRLHRLGDEAASHIEQVLPAALARFSHVMLLTHVPPTRSSCWYQGEVSDDEWAPHFTCKAMGDAILQIMRGHPDQQLTVLCGHTHSPGETRPLPNLQILTGGAEYGFPAIQRVFEF